MTSTTKLDEDNIVTECCIDCAMFIENNERPIDLDEEESAQWVTEFLRVTDGYILAVGDDAGFSMNTCTLCWSGLGGDRYVVTMMPIAPVQS